MKRRLPRNSHLKGATDWNMSPPVRKRQSWKGKTPLRSCTNVAKSLQANRPFRYMCVRRGCPILQQLPFWRVGGGAEPHHFLFLQGVNPTRGRSTNVSDLNLLSLPSLPPPTKVDVEVFFPSFFLLGRRCPFFFFFFCVSLFSFFPATHFP